MGRDRPRSGQGGEVGINLPRGVLTHASPPGPSFARSTLPIKGGFFFAYFAATCCVGAASGAGSASSGSTSFVKLSWVNAPASA